MVWKCLHAPQLYIKNFHNLIAIIWIYDWKTITLLQNLQGILLQFSLNLCGRNWISILLRRSEAYFKGKNDFTIAMLHQITLCYLKLLHSPKCSMFVKNRDSLLIHNVSLFKAKVNQPYLFPYIHWWYILQFNIR